MHYILIYTTFPDMATAKACGRTLVEEHLAACVNIFPSMHSIYHWEGEVEEAAEVAMFIKTRSSLEPTVIGRLKALHPYETPCALVLPVQGGSMDYLDWIEKSTKTIFSA